MTKVSKLKESIRQKEEKSKRLYEEMKKDTEMEKAFAEAVGLIWEEERDK